MTVTKIEELLDYEDYFPEDDQDVSRIMIKKPNSTKLKTRKNKQKRDGYGHVTSQGSFSLELLIGEKLGLIREEVTKRERTFARDRDVSVGRLRQDVHKNVLLIREQKKCNLLASRRNVGGHSESPCVDNDLDSIFELVWGFNNLTCKNHLKNDSSNLVKNYRKRKTTGIDSTKYYQTPDVKMLKLY